MRQCIWAGDVDVNPDPQIYLGRRRYTRQLEGTRAYRLRRQKILAIPVGVGFSSLIRDILHRSYAIRYIQGKENPGFA